MSEKLNLWKHHVSEHFPSGYTPKGRIDGAGVGGHMQENLAQLIEYLRKEGRQWSIAKIECELTDVIPDLTIGNGWYKALRDLPSQEGFMPLEEAERRYLS